MNKAWLCGSRSHPGPEPSSSQSSCTAPVCSQEGLADAASPVNTTLTCAVCLLPHLPAPASSVGIFFSLGLSCYLFLPILWHSTSFGTLLAKGIFAKDFLFFFPAYRLRPETSVVLSGLHWSGPNLDSIILSSLKSFKLLLFSFNWRNYIYLSCMTYCPEIIQESHYSAWRLL